jgi:hypothetical protein
MELAIPVVAFGWLYLISNQRNKPEPFVQKGTPFVQSKDKYFQPTIASTPENAANQFTDMAGRNMAVGELTSMNMVPFLGRTKAVGKEFREQTEQSLDAKTGTGSLQFTKAEVAPLFKPQENVQQPYGSQNNSDFFQSRVNPSMNAHNVKPFQEQWVGPGLNQGYGTEGSGGYNSGMEAREKWTEKTVDELRVLTNPKQTFTYDGHMGPAQSLIKNVGIEGKVEKHLPDKFFINTPDRYFTTVGQEVGPTYRSQQMNPDVSRVHVPYVGGAGQSGQEKMPQKPLIRQDHRQQFLTPLALAPAQGPVPASNVAAERKSMTAYANNRTTTSSEHNGNMGALISAITAPVTDFLRPTRKETVLTPKRLGNASMSGPTPQLLPTAKNVPTTTKETTTFSPFAAGMRPYLPASDGYTVTKMEVPASKRAETSVAYVGAAGSMLPQTMSYAADLNASIHSNRVVEGRTAVGNSTLFSGSINQTNHSMRQHNVNMGVAPSSLYPVPPVAPNETRAPQQYQDMQRNTPDILDAFRNNPYTHSLASVA